MTLPGERRSDMDIVCRSLMMDNQAILYESIYKFYMLSSISCFSKSNIFFSLFFNIFAGTPP